MNKKIWKCCSCGGYAEKNRRICKKFCCEKCLNESLNKECKVCGVIFSASSSRKQLCEACSSREIVNARAANRYKNSFYEKSCVKCGERVSLLGKQTECEPCREKSRQKMVHKYAVVTREKNCRICGVVCGEELVKNTCRTNEKNSRAVCLDCKEFSLWIRNVKNWLASPYVDKESHETIGGLLSKIEISNVKGRGVLRASVERLIAVGKSKAEHARRLSRIEAGRRRYVPVDKEQILKHRELASVRMKANNPMRKKAVAKKMAASLNKAIKTGKVKYKRGPLHHLWKGNRGFNLDCRNRLYSEWILPILKRDGFACTLCGKSRDLQVHHIRPLREIISLVLCQNSIYNIGMFDSKSPIYGSLIQTVVNEHKLSDGITVCGSCHSKIDKKYRRKSCK